MLQLSPWRGVIILHGSKKKKEYIWLTRNEFHLTGQSVIKDYTSYFDFREKMQNNEFNIKKK